jgi:hypothetical protein
MCEREGELKIKFEKERVRATERNLESLKNKNKTGEGEEQ